MNSPSLLSAVHSFNHVLNLHDMRNGRDHRELLRLFMVLRHGVVRDAIGLDGRINEF